MSSATKIETEIEAASARDTEKLLDGLYGDAEILLAKSLSKPVRRDIVARASHAEDGTDLHIVIGAWAAEEQAGAQDSGEASGWDVDVESDSYDDDEDVADWYADEDEDEGSGIEFLGVRDPGRVAQQVAELLRGIRRDGDFTICKHVGVTTDDGEVHLVEVKGFVD